jgi:hypothetical protein
MVKNHGWYCVFSYDKKRETRYYADKPTNAPIISGPFMSQEACKEACEGGLECVETFNELYVQLVSRCPYSMKYLQTIETKFERDKDGNLFGAFIELPATITKSNGLWHVKLGDYPLTTATTNCDPFDLVANIIGKEYNYTVYAGE